MYLFLSSHIFLILSHFFYLSHFLASPQIDLDGEESSSTISNEANDLLVSIPRTNTKKPDRFTNKNIFSYLENVLAFWFIQSLKLLTQAYLDQLLFFFSQNLSVGLQNEKLAKKYNQKLKVKLFEIHDDQVGIETVLSLRLITVKRTTIFIEIAPTKNDCQKLQFGRAYFV